MSIRCTLWVWQWVVNAGHDLSTHQLAVLCSLADRANEDGYSHASSSWHATRLNCDEKTVRRAAKELADKGLITVIAREGKTPVIRLEIGDWLSRMTPDRKSGVAPETPDTVSATPDTKSDDTGLDTTGSTGANAPSEPDAGAKVAKTKPAKPKSHPTRRCPANWEPSTDDVAVAISLGFDPPDIEYELAKLRDHLFRDGHTDWSAVWRNWMRREKETRDRHARRQPARTNEDRIAQHVAGAKLALGDRRSPERY